jgi:hypothetical protein
MQWSQLKTQVEERFATSVKKKVAIFSTRYGNCRCGRAWITVDGNEIANFCTRAKANSDAGATPRSAQPLGYGELSRQDAYRACWAFVHELSIDEALADSDPLVQTLAVLDRRAGKRRLESLEWQTLHPLARALLRVRLIAEGLPVPEALVQAAT